MWPQAESTIRGVGIGLKKGLIQSLALLVIIFCLMIAAGGAPAKNINDESSITSDVSGFADSRAVIYPCFFEGNLHDAVTGAPIKGAAVTFIKEDKSKAFTATTNAAGFYHRELPEGRYTYLATHSDHIMYSGAGVEAVRAPYIERVRGAGGVVREITISSERSKVIDMNMNPRPENVLLVTTSLLSVTPALNDAIDQYSEVIARKDGLTASHIVLDSAECAAGYGVRLSDPGSWEEVRSALREIVQETGPCYIILLGGEDVVPRPTTLYVGRNLWYLPSDAWYANFNEDGIVDEGMVISRMADVSVESSAIATALETASAVHEAGGFGLIPEVDFSTRCWAAPPVGLGDACRDDAPSCGQCYATPPYGICDDCDRREEFFDLISSSDFVFFMGHGSPEVFATNEHLPIFRVENLEDVDLQANHPLIAGYFSCNTGLLRDDEPTFATEFLRAGASAFVARNTDEGTPNYFADKFPAYLAGDGSLGRYRIGDALFELMRETILRKGSGEMRSVMQLSMYGDPTLKRIRLELPDMRFVARASYLNA
jgi:hypothetical protein